MSEQETAKITVLRNYGGFRAESADELRQLVVGVFGEDAWEPFVAGFAADFSITTMASAVQNVQAAGLTAPASAQPAPTEPAQAYVQVPQPAPQQTSAQPAPQATQVPPWQPPTAQPAPSAAQLQGGEVPPPTIPYPGDCPHGRRAYFSINPAKSGPNVGRPWPRWECALKFTSGNKHLRCETMSVDSR